MIAINKGTGPCEYITFLWDGEKIVGFSAPMPSNMHAHLRMQAMMRAILKEIMLYVHCLLVMPNSQPIKTLVQLEEYCIELREFAAANNIRVPYLIMTLYYSNLITPQVIDQISEVEERLGIRIGIKWYPPEPGTTTGAGHGGMPLDASHDHFRAMVVCKTRFLIHAESVVNKYGRALKPIEGEAYFIEHELRRFRDALPDLLHSVEHLTTRQAVEYVQADSSGNTFSTATPHGTMCTVHDLDGPFGALLKCKTLLQTPDNRDCVAEFAFSGDSRVGAGDDTAGHPASRKFGRPFVEVDNGAFWTSRRAFGGYAKVANELHGIDDRYAYFSAFNGPDWWELPRPEQRVAYLLRQPERVRPIPLPETNDSVLPVGWAGGEDRDTLNIYFSLGPDLVCEAVTA